MAVEVGHLDRPWVSRAETKRAETRVEAGTTARQGTLHEDKGPRVPKCGRRQHYEVLRSLLVASLLLVAMPFVTSSDARSYVRRFLHYKLQGLLDMSGPGFTWSARETAMRVVQHNSKWWVHSLSLSLSLWHPGWFRVGEPAPFVRP